MSGKKIIISRNFWKFDQQDYSVIVLVVVGITVLAALLYFNFLGEVSKAGKKVGVVIVKEKNIQRKQEGELIWDNIEDIGPTYERDTVRVGDLSSALLILDKDQVIIDMDENTMLVLDFLASESGNRIQFEYGSLRVDQAEKKEGEPASNPVELQFKGEKLKLEGGDVRFSKDESKDQLNVAVVKGKSKITTQSGKETVLVQNEVLSVQKDGEVKKKKLVLALEAGAPSDGQNFFTSAKKAKVNFTWSASDEAKKVFLEVSRISSFSKKRGKLIRRKVRGKSLVLALGEGIHYWRIAAKAPDSSENEYSLPKKFTIASKGGISVYQPPKRQRFTYRIKPSPVNFSWGENKHADKYFLEIASDKKFTNVVNKQLSKSRNYSTELKEGKYYWRVSTRSAFPDAQVTSEVRGFRVVKDNTPLLIKTYSPSSKETLSQAKVEIEGYVFNWQDHSDISKTQIIIAKDASFKKITLKETLTSNFYTLKKELPAGKYYWAIKSVGGKNALKAKSSVKTFKMKEDRSPLNIKTYSPTPQEVLSQTKVEEGGYLFNWEDNVKEHQVQLIIAEDASLKKVIIKENLNKNSYILKRALKGKKYYWMLEAKNKKRIIAKSAVRVFKVKADRKKPPVEIKVNAPAPQEALSELKVAKKGYVFKWQKVKNISPMEIIIAENASLKKVILQKKLKKNSYTLKRKLPIGNYYWGLEARNKAKDITAKSVVQSFKIEVDKEEIARKKREEEAARKRQEEEAKKKREEEARKQKEEEAARKKQEEEAEKKREEEAKKVTLKDIRKKYGKISKITTRSGKTYVGNFSQAGLNIHIRTVKGKVTVATRDIKRITAY